MGLAEELLVTVKALSPQTLVGMEKSASGVGQTVKESVRESLHPLPAVTMWRMVKVVDVVVLGLATAPKGW